MRLSKRLVGYQRRSVRAILNHTYSYQAKNVLVVGANDVPILDEFGHKQYTDTIIIPDRKCLFLWQDTHVEGEAGNTTSRIPSLLVLYTDDVFIGGIVQNVLSRDGSLLIRSAFIETIDTTSEGGDSPLKLLTLSGAVTQ